MILISVNPAIHEKKGISSKAAVQNAKAMHRVHISP